MAVLGAHEHHCVESYHLRAAAGEYAVYRIIDENDVVSTLGITHPKEDHQIDQHYHAFNKQINDKKRIEFGSYVTYEVKKVMYNKVVIEKKEPIRLPLGGNNHEIIF